MTDKEAEEKCGGLSTAVLASPVHRTAVEDELGLQPPNGALPEAPFSLQEAMRPAPGITVTSKEEHAAPLFSAAEAKEFRGRWDTIQGTFVDEPRHAVEQADSLVAGAMKRLAEVFAEERGKLEGQWDREESVSTEDLRLALRRYRSFFGRLLSV